MKKVSDPAGRKSTDPDPHSCFSLNFIPLEPDQDPNKCGSGFTSLHWLEEGDVGYLYDTLTQIPYAIDRLLLYVQEVVTHCT